VLNRKVYITPKTFLEMIDSFFYLLEEKRNEIRLNRTRYIRGVDQLVRTNKEVIEMQENLTKMAPVLEIKKEESEKLAE